MDNNPIFASEGHASRHQPNPMPPSPELKRKRPSVPRPHNPQRDFDEACSRLQLKLEHHKTIQALAVRFLQERHHIAGPGDPDAVSPVDDTAVFLEAFGPALFPSNRAYRHHLFDVDHAPGYTGKYWACRSGVGGPVFALDSRLTMTARAIWRRNRSGTVPGRDEEVRHSKLGHVITRLLQAVLDFMRNNVVKSETRSASDLLEAIIGRAGDEALPTLTGDDTRDMPSSRVSSPEAPLIDGVRKRSLIVLPKKRTSLALQPTDFDALVFERVSDMSEFSPMTVQGPSVPSRTAGPEIYHTTDGITHTSSAFSLVDEIFSTLTSGSGAAQTDASLSEVLSAQQLQGAIDNANAHPMQSTVRRCVPPIDMQAMHAQTPKISPLRCHGAVDIATSSFVVHNTQEDFPQVIATLPEVKVLPPAAWTLPTLENTRKSPGSGQWTQEDRDRVLALRAAAGWMGGLPLVSGYLSAAGPGHRGSS